jgi:hypothetical protein
MEKEEAEVEEKDEEEEEGEEEKNVCRVIRYFNEDRNIVL